MKDAGLPGLTRHLRGPADVYKIRGNAQGDPKDPRMTLHILMVEGHREMTQPLEGSMCYHRVGLRQGHL